MKKRCALIITTILFLITGCTNEKIKFSESDAWKTKWQTREEREVAKIVPYQNGFYYENLQSCLSYFDIPSSKTIVLCNKNGCNHKNKKCFAYMENQQMPMIHDDQLLFVSYEGEVSTAEVDNTEKEKNGLFLKN